MKVTYVPANGSEKNPSIEPEKMAAVAARYSRSDLGMPELLNRFRDTSPDHIFKFVDYGHASIAELTGSLTIAMDGITMLLATKLFEFAQMAAGQECSTRYIPMTIDSLADPAALGIPEEVHALWRSTCSAGFDLYHRCYNSLDPAKAKIPEAIKDKPKMVERFVRNYQLDRARYFIPMAARTNVCLMMSAGKWAELTGIIDSLGWPEAQQLAGKLRQALNEAAPNLVRHSLPTSAAHALHEEQLGLFAAYVREQPWLRVSASEAEDGAFLRIQRPAFHAAWMHVGELEGTMEHRENRYQQCALSLKRGTATFGFQAIALAELRDLNRHRTGFRWSPWAPVGFYYPAEEFDSDLRDAVERWKQLKAELLKGLCQLEGRPGFQAYGYFLGTQVGFEHTTQLDKLVYEIELRTGLGAHFRYAGHMRNIAALLKSKMPELQPWLRVGEAEPEAV